MDAQLRRVDVHLQVGILVVEQAAHVLADLHAVHGEFLVRPLGLHLEGPGRLELGAQVVSGAVEDGVLVLGAGAGPGGGHNAEHLPAGGVGPVQIAVLLLGLHVDGALLGVDPEAAAAGQAAADVAGQLVLKGAAVEALEDHLAQLQQNNLIHGGSFLSEKESE